MMSTARPDEITQSLPIPEYKMGWIVGKKGSYINQLSRKSGAHISISETSTKEYGIVWKYVQITGTGRSVDRAKKLLHIRLDRLEPRGGGAENSNNTALSSTSGGSGNGVESSDVSKADEALNESR